MVNIPEMSLSASDSRGKNIYEQVSCAQHTFGTNDNISNRVVVLDLQWHVSRLCISRQSWVGKRWNGPIIIEPSYSQLTSFMEQINKRHICKELCTDVLGAEIPMSVLNESWHWPLRLLALRTERSCIIHCMHTMS